MKKLLILLILYLSIFALPSEAVEHNLFGLKLNEIAVESGFSVADLKTENPFDLETVPLNFRFAYDLNEPLNLGTTEGKLQLSIEPYINTITEPSGSLWGLGFFLRYSYPILNNIDIYGEGGIGPSYLDLDTFEQASGFNFHSQAGLGFRYYFANDKSLNFGYRYGHISHGELRDSRNGGIDTHTGLIGISTHFH